MNNDSIVITAKLDVDASEALIINDLDTITTDLKSNPLKINCSIDDTALKNIQSQISELSEGFKIDVGAVNVQSLQNSVNQVVKAEPIRVSVEPDIKKGELQKQVNAFVEKFHLTFDKSESKALKAELGEILTKYDQVKKAGNWDEMNRQWDNLTSFVEQYATEIDTVSDRLREATKQSKLFISQAQKEELLYVFDNSKGAVQDYLNSVIGRFKWTYNKSNGGLGWDTYSTKLNDLIQTGLYDVNANRIDDVAKINTTHIVEGLEQLGNLLNQDKSLADDWYKTYAGDIESLRQMWEGLRQGVVDYLNEIRGEKQSLADMGWEDIGSSESTEKIRNYTQVLQEGIEKIASLKAQIKAEGGDEIKSIASSFSADATGNVDGFVLAIQKSNGEVENLYHKLVEVEDETGNITREWARTQISGSDKGLLRSIEKINNEANKLERGLLNAKAQADNLAAPRPIKSEEGIAKVSQAYNQAIEAIEKLRQADASTFSELDNDANKAIDNFNNIVKVQRDLEFAATKLRAKPIETIKADELSHLNEFTTTISGSAIPNVENLIQRVETLREVLSKVNDKRGLTDYLNSLTEVTADFEALEAEAKAVKKALGDLDKLSANAQFARNAQNPDVTSQLANIDALKAKYQQLFSDIGNAKAPEDLQRISESLSQLKPEFDAVVQSSQNLSNQLKSDDASAAFNAKLANLTNQVETFANTNKKATESLRQMRSGVTFADEWQRITSALKGGNLDDNAIRRLTEDFRNFKGEARSVGVTTSSFFNNMGNQLKMLVSRWVSLYAVIGKIRTMVDYVTQLDTAMTKLKRVTDETAAGYERFLETAKESARETNTTLVDTVEQAAKWAKSGYDAATSAELAKTSLIYSIVGDVDNDTAVSDLVTALRGFRLEAEDALSIVDKLDALNNKYATDAKSLGEALSVSASAMAAAGSDLDETLALITGATEITQNAKETGQAIRTITMRIRGMKGELEKLGEEAEGVESVSKIQTQILNLTKGRVNIFDDNQNFKAPYEILKEVSEIYNELSDPDKADLTEILFGKLRSNQGLAIISAFQSGQIPKALKDSQNAAGTATEEMERYAESIQAHLNQFKEAAQELSADAIDTEFVKDIINDGITLLTLLNDIVKAFKEIKDIIPQSLKDAYNYITDNPILNPFREILKLANTGDELYSKLFGDNDAHIDEVNEMSAGLDSVVQKYIEYNGIGEDSESITAKLSSEIENINEAYSDNSDKIDLVNKGLSENLSLMRQMEKQEIGEWLRKNAEDYEKAIGALKNVDTVDEYGRAPFAYQMNAKGVGRYTKKQYDAFDKLGLDNYVSGQNTGYVYDFALTGTLEEQLDSLTKIRDVYASLQDREQDRLDQFDAEIEKIKDQISEYNNLIKTYDQYKTRYESMQNVTAQEYNLIEQAINAYKEYQSAVLSDDRDSATNAYTTLNSIKEIVYSMTDTNSVLRQDFNDLWATFVFGATEGMSKIEEVRADFAELSGEAFDNELKNIESISKAIDSMLNDETLSHEDAWKLLNLDTEGVLSDIQLINGQYKLSTDQLVALMEQQINKQKESIETVKAAAQAELDLLQAQLRRLKVNSPSDVAAYKLEVERITDEMRDMQDVISGSDLLLQEVNGILGKTYSITGSIATGLSNAVKQFEAEVDAIDDAIDSLNDRKEVLQDEKSILQDQLDALNEQKKTIEDTLATYDKVGEAVDELVKAQVDGIQAQIDALEEERKSIEDYYEEQLDALKEQNEERDDAIEKEEALANLANAQNQKKRVYSSDRGWDYEASKADILKAQNELAKIANNEQIKTLENERDAKLAGYDDRKKEYETQIKEYEDYASKYTSISNDIKIAENELLAAQILGSDWREKIEQKDEGLLTNYRAQYTSFNEQLNNLTNNEIATLQASINAKDAEIKKIDDEIAAYNKYKKSVEKSLNDAKTALENYKNSMNDAKTEIINALDGVERETQDKNGKIISHNEAMAKSAEDAKDRMNHAYWEIGNSARELANTLQEHLLHGDIDLAQYVRMMRLDGYADGGVNTSTGIAMLHGTKQKGEVIFNASDSKKLYDMIHGTPNLLADVVKQANKITGFSPVNSTNTNSVSVSIGQIVANNPQEFTRGLDVELDKYFRRKLTESYVQ